MITTRAPDGANKWNLLPMKDITFEKFLPDKRIHEKMQF